MTWNLLFIHFAIIAGTLLLTSLVGTAAILSTRSPR